VHSDTLRNRFIGIAKQRSDFADELAAQLKDFGEAPPDSGHQSGIQERGWRDLEGKIRPKDDTTFLVNCEQGEENTLRHYEHALTVNLAPLIRAVVERQRLAVQEALLELRILEQMPKAG
jgi:uncharacterized protein (TIGR02284 family)